MLKKYQAEQEAKQKISARSRCGRWLRHILKIGEGGYKFVFRGYDTVEARNVAWCQFKNVDTKEKRQAVFKETEIMLKMSHPHIVRCFDVFRDWTEIDDHNNATDVKGVVIIQELMDEGTLKSVIRKNFLEGQCILKFPLITRWWHQILDALRYMHHKLQPSVLHRDLKADNCFLYRDSDEECLNVKVGDFGLATQVNNSGRKTMLGTLGFMAPEIYEEMYGEKVDIYAFGMLMLEVVTNRTPYDECDTVMQVAAKTMSGQGPDILTKIYNPQLREVICACIQPLMCFRPTAEELYFHPLFQPKSLPVEVEPNYNFSKERAEIFKFFIQTFTDPKTRNPKFNLRLRFRDKKMLLELGLDDGESLEFDLDIYKAEDQDIPDLIHNLRLEYEDKLCRVYENPKQPDKKIVSTHLDKLFSSIRLQMQYMVKLLLGKRWKAILDELVEEELERKKLDATSADQADESDTGSEETSSFTLIGLRKSKWNRAKRLLDREIQAYRAGSSTTAPTHAVQSATTSATGSARVTPSASTRSSVMTAPFETTTTTSSGSQSATGHASTIYTTNAETFDTMSPRVITVGKFCITTPASPTVPLNLHNAPPFQSSQQENSSKQNAINHQQFGSTSAINDGVNVVVQTAAEQHALSSIPYSHAFDMKSHLDFTNDPQSAPSFYQPLASSVSNSSEQSVPAKFSSALPVTMPEFEVTATSANLDPTPLSVLMQLVQAWNSTGNTGTDPSNKVDFVSLHNTLFGGVVSEQAPATQQQQPMQANTFQMPVTSQASGSTVPSQQPPISSTDQSFLSAANKKPNVPLQLDATHGAEIDMNAIPECINFNTHCLYHNTLPATMPRSKFAPTYLSMGFDEPVNWSHSYPYSKRERGYQAAYRGDHCTYEFSQCRTFKSPRGCVRQHLNQHSPPYLCSPHFCGVVHEHTGPCIHHTQNNMSDALSWHHFDRLHCPSSFSQPMCTDPLRALLQRLTSPSSSKHFRGVSAPAAHQQGERKPRRKPKSKPRYLLRVTKLERDLENGNPLAVRPTFYLEMPDVDNPDSELWKLSFRCNLSDTADDLKLFDGSGYTPANEDIAWAAKEAVLHLLAALRADVNSVRINEDYVFYPRPSTILIPEVSSSNYSSQPSSNLSSVTAISQPGPTHSRSTLTQSSPLPTAPPSVTCDDSTPMTGLEVEPIIFPPSQSNGVIQNFTVDASPQSTFQECCVPDPACSVIAPTVAAKEEVVGVKKHSNQLSIPENPVSLQTQSTSFPMHVPTDTTEKVSIVSSTTYFSASSCDNNLPLNDHSHAVSTVVQRVEGLNSTESDPGSLTPIDISRVKEILSLLNQPGDCLDAVIRGYQSGLEEVSPLQPRILEAPVTTTKSADIGRSNFDTSGLSQLHSGHTFASPPVDSCPVVNFTCKIPSGLEGILQEVANRLCAEWKQPIVVLPSFVSSNSAKSYQVLDVPEDHVFLGVPNPSDPSAPFSLNTFSALNKSSFVVLNDGRANDSMASVPRMYQLPSDTALILSDGLIHRVERATLVVPVHPSEKQLGCNSPVNSECTDTVPISSSVQVKELPIQSSMDMLTLDDVLNVLLALRSTSQFRQAPNSLSQSADASIVSSAGIGFDGYPISCVASRRSSVTGVAAVQAVPLPSYSHYLTQPASLLQQFQQSSLSSQSCNSKIQQPVYTQRLPNPTASSLVPAHHTSTNCAQPQLASYIGREKVGQMDSSFTSYISNLVKDLLHDPSVYSRSDSTAPHTQPLTTHVQDSSAPLNTTELINLVGRSILQHQQLQPSSTTTTTSSDLSISSADAMRQLIQFINLFNTPGISEHLLTVITQLLEYTTAGQAAQDRISVISTSSLNPVTSATRPVLPLQPTQYTVPLTTLNLPQAIPLKPVQSSRSPTTSVVHSPDNQTATHPMTLAPSFQPFNAAQLISLIQQMRSLHADQMTPTLAQHFGSSQMAVQPVRPELLDLLRILQVQSDSSLSREKLSTDPAEALLRLILALSTQPSISTAQPIIPAVVLTDHLTGGINRSIPHQSIASISAPIVVTNSVGFGSISADTMPMASRDAQQSLANCDCYSSAEAIQTAPVHQITASKTTTVANKFTITPVRFDNDEPTSVAPMISSFQCSPAVPATIP